MYTVPLILVACARFEPMRSADISDALSVFCHVEREGGFCQLGSNFTSTAFNLKKNKK
jgi:hypothetical protein